MHHPLSNFQRITPIWTRNTVTGFLPVFARSTRRPTVSLMFFPVWHISATTTSETKPLFAAKDTLIQKDVLLNKGGQYIPAGKAWTIISVFGPPVWQLWISAEILKNNLNIKFFLHRFETGRELSMGRENFNTNLYRLGAGDQPEAVISTTGLTFNLSSRAEVFNTVELQSAGRPGKHIYLYPPYTG